jgi:hypothetical protein
MTRRWYRRPARHGARSCFLVNNIAGIRWLVFTGAGRMTPQTIEERLDRLERRVTKLERLPARIDALTLQVSQLRVEMRDEFSAVRGEMTQMREELRGEMHAIRDDLIEQIDGKIDGTIDGLAVQMRVLHEEVISRIALLSEAGPAPRPRKKR